MEKDKKPEKPSQRLNKQLSGYARYTTIAFKMIAIVVLGTLGGLKLDEVLELSIPIFTLVCALASVALAMYVIIRDVSR